MPPQTSESKGVVSAPKGGDEKYNVTIDLKRTRDAIPKHCFEISTMKGMFYYLQDMTILTLLYAGRFYLGTDLFAGDVLGGGALGAVASFIARFVWWNFVGLEMWALFVVGHDCGHGTFSTSWIVNTIMGHICHVPILVPFHGWARSHRIHHMYHNDLGRDKTWAPLSESHLAEWNETTFPGAVYKFIRFTPLALLMFPYYLIAPGGELTYGSHLNPFNSQIFPSIGDKIHGFIGGSLCMAFLGAIMKLVVRSEDPWGAFVTAWDWYFVPYWIFIVWLSLVTYLHHMSKDSVFFRAPEWTFVKGAETTVDRNYGSIVNYLHHNIETHLVHHLFFTKVPHYHLVEATQAAKHTFGDVYRYDDRNPLWTFIKEAPLCRFVPDTGAVVRYVFGREPRKAKSS